MRKILTFLICCLFTALCYASGSVVVKQGNIAIFKKTDKAELVIDYSVAKVNGTTLDGYLQSRGDDFVRDWPDDAKKARQYFVNRFNKKNKKGLQITETGTSNYKMVIQVTTLDMGSAGAVVGGRFNPFNFSSKTGGAVISGLVEIINKTTGKSLCCVEANDIQGTGTYSETVRLGMAYYELASKILKEAKNAYVRGDFVESEPVTLAGGASPSQTVSNVPEVAEAPTKAAANAETAKQQPVPAAPEETAAAAVPANGNAELMAMLANAKGVDIPRRRKPVRGDFSNIAKQSRIGAYLDFSNADIDGRSEDEFIHYMETAADDGDLDSKFGEKWEDVKSSLCAVATSKVNKKLRNKRLRLKFSSALDTDYILKMEVVSVNEDGDNKINYLFVNTKTEQVEAQITCESGGGVFGRYIGLLKQGFESAGNDFADRLLDEID